MYKSQQAIIVPLYGEHLGLFYNVGGFILFYFCVMGVFAGCVRLCRSQEFRLPTLEFGGVILFLFGRR